MTKRATTAKPRNPERERERENDKFISTKITITTHFFTSPVSLTCFHCFREPFHPLISLTSTSLSIIMNPANDFTLVYFPFYSFLGGVDRAFSVLLARLRGSVSLIMSPCSISRKFIYVNMQPRTGF